ncbi:ankyrin-2-like isoform X2 [Penaeus monodon]|uniref:ankyrin-2-like isoform X2 n=1 Tax=Penaeus monodon TaxID=6687 RepID=UPI0018A71D1D|nr:ankyrin-2-like isoform X2 [Penaeus monodon]
MNDKLHKCVNLYLRTCRSGVYYTATRSNGDLSIKAMGAILNRLIAEGDVPGVQQALSQGTSPDGAKNEAKKPIHLATERGSLAIIKSLCNKGADVNVRDLSNSGRAPLHIAIRKNTPDIVKFLLEKQARPSVADDTGETPLHTAIEMNDITSVGLLLKYKANVHLKDASHNFPLHIAVRKNNCEIVNMLLNAGASVHIVDASGDWLLHVAAKFASTTILEKLKEKGCKVNKRNADGLSPLHLAAKSRNLEAVNWFTDNGAKLDDLDGKKKTPENRAVRGKQKHLVQRRNDRTGLKTEGKICHILVKGDVEALRQLIPHHDIDALCVRENNKGLRAVHYAAIGGRVEMLKVLKENKFDFQAATQQGLTPLHYAVRYGHLDAAKWLVTEAGSRASLRDNKGNSALDMARQAKKEQIQEYLQRTAQGTIGRHRLLGLWEAQPTRTREGHGKALAKDLHEQLTEVERRRAPRPAYPLWRPVEREQEKEPAKEADPKTAQGTIGRHRLLGLTEAQPTRTREGHGKALAKDLHAQLTEVERRRAPRPAYPLWRPVEREQEKEPAKEADPKTAQGTIGRLWLLGLTEAQPTRTREGHGKALAKDWHAQLTEVERRRAPRPAYPLWRPVEREQEKEPAKEADPKLTEVERRRAPRPAYPLWRPVEREQEKEPAKEADPKACVGEALSSGDLKILIKLIEKGTDVDTLIYESNDQGMRAVHYAAQSGNMEMLRALKQRKVDLKSVTRKGFTALHCAVLNGQLDAVRWLVAEAGLDAACHSKGGETALDLAKTLKKTEISNYLQEPHPEAAGRPLFLGRPPTPAGTRERDQERKEEPKEMDEQACVKKALSSGDLKILIKLIEKGTDVDTLIYESNDQGMRAVHYAAQSGNMEMLRALKQRKVDLKSVTRKGFTALHCAVLNGQLDAVRWLVAEAGLDAACHSKGGETALDLAKTLKKTEISNYLSGLIQKPRGAEGTILRPNVLPMWVREGDAMQDLNLKKQAKEAARAGDVQGVRAVMQRGFRVDTEFQEATNQGWRLLHFAADGGHAALVAFLIQENANVNAVAKDGMTPLHLASWGGHTEVIRELLSNRANGKAKTTEGMTAIHLASMGGHVSSMEALVPTCDILSVTSEGMSALHLAAEYGNLGAVQWLRLQGLDASLRDNKGWTPRQYAKDEGQKKVVEFLEKLEKQHSPQGLTQHEKELSELQGKLKAKETEIQLLNRRQQLKDQVQERTQAQIKNELQEMREVLKAQNDMIARLQNTMLSKDEPEKEEKK